jgi:cob(I)alamin adenosyltransferase
MEEEMDKMYEELTPLRNFFLSVGSENHALAHVCRSICRRAELEIIDLDEKNSLIFKYLNRLSDYFFVLSRFILKAEGVEEEAWSKD